MARQRRRISQSGFSMVEMLVAMLFTGILMAGMSQVFKSSLSSFYTSSETLSSARRSRMSLDLLYDDLNAAGMFLVNLTSPPSNSSDTNPLFYVRPNQPVVGAGAGADDPLTADELLFYVDMPLSFEGRLVTASSGASLTVGEQIEPGAYTINCGNASYASLVKKGMYFVAKDSFEALYITEATASGKNVNVTTSSSPNSGVTGMGAADAPARFQHIADGNTQVLVFIPAQALRYSIKMKPLDPDPQAQNPAGIPCLVRDQGTYDPSGFTPDPALEAIVAENVQGFKVYLSFDSGRTWAGDPATGGADFTDWAGLKSSATEQVVKLAQPEFPNLEAADWFRKRPVLVRLDITTRTAVKRPEYAKTADTTAYKNTTQTVVMVPRHFGLPIR